MSERCSQATTRSARVRIELTFQVAMRTGTDHTECLHERRPGSGHPVGDGSTHLRGTRRVFAQVAGCDGGTPARSVGAWAARRVPVEDSEETT